jgi:hypothetical protein
MDEQGLASRRATEEETERETHKPFLEWSEEQIR